MKKLLAFILILVLLLPAAAWAETDPIVGQWYYMFDFEQYSELSSAFPGYNNIVNIYSFTKDAIINCLEGHVTTDGTISSTYTPVGKWEKKDGKYTYSIVGVGQDILIVENDELFLKMPSGLYMKCRRLVTFDPYADYVMR